MSGGFGMSFVKGALISLIGVSAVSLVAPLQPLDPGKTSQVDLSTPSGSGFNQNRDDTNPVLPDTDQTVAQEEVQKPESGQTAQELETPIADTASASKPSASNGIELPEMPEGSDDVAILSPVEDVSPSNAPPALGVPMPIIDNPIREIPVNQLPVIEPPKPSNTTSENSDLENEPEPVEAPTPRAATALERNKAGFQNPGGKPLMSIILVDAGEQGLEQEVLLTFSFPVTFALDPTAKGATAKAKIFTREGFEVLALAPTGAAKLEAAENEADLEAAIAAVFAKLPDAVGLVDGPSAELQQSPKLAKQIIAAMQKTGHGLLTYDIGLNGTNKSAQAADMFADTVFRVLDQDGEQATTIKRYLDRAVLEAGKDGHVIVLGRTYPGTVTALFSWAVSAKATTIALAPVSASLLNK